MTMEGQSKIPRRGSKGKVFNDVIGIEMGQGSSGQSAEAPEAEKNEIFPTFIDVLKDSVRLNSKKVFVSWYDSKGNPTKSYTYQEIWDEALYVANYLRVEKKIAQGERVLLCYSPGLKFFASFFGCLRANVVAVPVYPPDPRKLDVGLKKLKLVCEDCDAKLILTDTKVNKLLVAWKIQSKFSRGNLNINLPFDVHPRLRKKSKYHNFEEPKISDSDLAFLQYTSGSTGNPKGVMITYGAVRAQTKGIIDLKNMVFNRANKSEEKTISFNWLPQYHDMGLMATISPFVGGWNCNMISPMDFLLDPILWVKLMSILKVNFTQAPNFAYKLVTRKFQARKKRDPSFGADIDLSHLLVTCCAAEPIQLDTIPTFAETFSDSGFKISSFLPSWGLAESVAQVTSVQGLRISEGHDLVAVAKKSEFNEGLEIKIICPEQQIELPDGSTGEIWIRGPSVAVGYWKREELSQETFQAKISGDEDKTVYLRTGDLGFFEDDHLYICGRIKDVVIVNGRNFWPHDIEFTVQDAHKEGVRPGCVAAFSSDDNGGSGVLEIVFEIRKNYEAMKEEVIESVRNAVLDDIGLPPARIVAVKEKMILKTTSGKIRRRDNRKALHNNEFAKCTVGSWSARSALQGTKAPDKINTDDADSKTPVEDFDAVIESFFGTAVDPDAMWEDLGMTSVTSVQLQDSLSESFRTDLEPNCFRRHSTPALLKEHVLRSAGEPLTLSSLDIQKVSSRQLSWGAWAALQACGSFVILLLLSFCILLAWYVGTSIDTTLNGSSLKWVVMPLIIPIWMLAYSVIVIMLKWLLVGKFQEGEFDVYSLAYIRWWTLDRALDIWENTVGKFILSSPILNAFYAILGTNVSMNVYIDAFIREFDLVSIGNHSSVESSISCRKFGIWDDEVEPTIRFRRIMIAERCTLRGMISPGASVEHSSLVDHLANVPECAIVPAQRKVSSNPAVLKDNEVPSPSSPHCWWKVGIFKSLWLLFEMYHFSAIIALGHYIWEKLVSIHFRYERPTRWMVLFLFYSCVSVISSILLKWLLIGKKKANGPKNSSLLRKLADDCCNWHFVNTTFFLYHLSYSSRVWNVVLMLHGLDVDLVSWVFADRYLPSKVDMIRIRKSMVSAVLFIDSSSPNQKISISESSVGNGCCISSGSSISSMIVFPLSKINAGDHIGDEPRIRNKIASISMGHIFYQEILLFLLFLLNLFIIWSSFVPSFELWVAIKPTSAGMAAFTLTLCFLLHVVVFCIIFRLYEHVTLLKASTKKQPWNQIIYFGGMHMGSALYNFTLLTSLQGSLMFNILMLVMGVSFEGSLKDTILQPAYSREHRLLTIAEHTIVDCAVIESHHGVYGSMNLGPCRIAGTVHPRSIVTNATLRSDESGPFRAYVASYDKDGMNASSKSTARISFGSDDYIK